MAMADRLVVMREGRVQQTGTQEDLYERPATPFVASFIGRSNMLAGTLDNGVLAAGGAWAALAGRYAGSGTCTLALRPERLSLGPPDASGPGVMPGRVELASYLGPVREHLVLAGAGQRVVVRDTTARPGPLLAPGEAVTVRWDAAAERLFDAAGAPMASYSFPTPSRMTHHV